MSVSRAGEPKGLTGPVAGQCPKAEEGYNWRPVEPQVSTSLGAGPGLRERAKDQGSQLGTKGAKDWGWEPKKGQGPGLGACSPGGACGSRNEYHL